MPQHREEPRVYTGRVRMMSGNRIGEFERMEYHVAQAMVASGQARWEQDTSPMPRHIASIVAEKERQREQQIAEDAAHSAALREAANPPKPTRDLPAVNALVVTMVDDVPYLARPAPTNIELAPEMIGVSKGEYGITAQDGGVIVIKLANASLMYREIAKVNDFVNAEMIEADQPEVEIPEGWRDVHHMQRVGFAKRIRRVDAKTAMKKDEADAIIEEWLKGSGYDTRPVPADDGSADPDTEDKGGARETRIVDGQIVPERTPEEIAKEAEKRFIEDDF